MPTIEHNQPDFIIIGAMKAATSAIYEYLMQHPAVAHRLPKELHFFTLNYDKGWDWYLSQFESAKGNNRDLLIGEASPSYLSSPKAPKLIHKLLPDVKIIVSLRNPADRAISHYYHQFNRVGDETRPIEIAFSQQEIDNLDRPPRSKTSSYIQLGKYAHQIKNWLAVFPKEQILILDYHDLETKPRRFVREIFQFLNLAEYPLNNIQKIYGNQYPPVPSEIRIRLERHFAESDRALKALIDVADLSDDVQNNTVRSYKL